MGKEILIFCASSRYPRRFHESGEVRAIHRIVRINEKLFHKILARHGLTMDVPICYNIDRKAKERKRRMNGKEGREPEVNVGCGCGGCLLEIIAFVLICSLFGCEWARNALSDWTRWIGSTVRSACEAPADKPGGETAR